VEAVAIQTWTETCPFRAEAGTQNACPSHHEESKIAHGFCGVVRVREISRGGKEEEGSLNGGGDEAKVMESESRSACGNEVEEIVNGSGRESGKGSAVVEMESAGGLLGKVNDGVGFCFVGQHFDTALCNPCWVFPGLCLEEAGVASFPSSSDSHPLLFLSWPYPPPVSSTVPSPSFLPPICFFAPPSLTFPPPSFALSLLVPPTVSFCSLLVSHDQTLHLRNN
jgi:hypothetical protein